MKRVATLLVLASLTVFAVAGCTPPATTTTPGSTPATSTAGPGTAELQFMTVGKTQVALDGGKVYDPATTKYAAMDGEPSMNPMFVPEKPEGVKEVIYPPSEAKTFKFLTLSTSNITPQHYYMFVKGGGSLNKAVASTGYKFSSLYDSGDNKINTNLYIGYYDFAFVTTGRMTENWSGNISRQGELWKAGDTYVTIGASQNDGDTLWAPAGITDLKQLDGKSVAIMNPNYQTEAAFNDLLKKVGLATVSGGGTVKVTMAPPGAVMNDLLAGKFDAAFARSTFKQDLLDRGFHELADTSDAWTGKNSQTILIVRRDILEKHPDIVQAVVQANWDASEQAKESDEWIKGEGDPLTAFRVEFDGNTSKVRAPKPEAIDAQANPDYMKGVYDFMKASGFFKTSYAYEQLVNDSFYSKVKK